VWNKNVVALIEFHRATVSPTDASPGERPEHVIALDPNDQ